MGHQYNDRPDLIYLSVMQTFQTRLAWLATAGVVALTACSDSSSSPSEPISSFLAAVDSGYDFSVYLTAPPGD
ncbi:MAG TPA: hypothetical protein VLA89_11305, partial [Gemmatimonadales bacterium]|nr:hypothetical protein [Gemmatimonadales bacterium]